MSDAEAIGRRKGVVHVVAEYVGPINSTGYYWARLIDGIAKSAGRVIVWFPVGRKSCNSKPGPSTENAEYRPILLHLPEKRGVFIRAAREIVLAFHLGWKLCGNVKRDDLVVSGTNPALLMVLLAALRKLFGYRWILVVYDVFPENLESAGLSKAPRWMRAAFQLVFDWAYAAPSRVIAIGRDMAELMIRKGVPASAVVVQQNWAGPEALESTLPYPFSAHCKPWPAENIVFQFFGNMGRVQGIDVLLTAIDLVTASNATFVFVGDGALAQRVRDRARRGGPVVLHYVEAQPMEMSSSIIAGCDVSVVSLDRGMLGLGVPSKAYFALAADKPILVIGDEGSELFRVIDEYGVGWKCASGDPADIAATIDRICEQGVSNLRGLPRKVLVEHYSEDRALSTYVGLVCELLDAEERRQGGIA